MKQLESATKRDTDELAELTTLLARVDKRSQWVQKRLRTQRRKTAATERGLGLARCYVAAARVREYVAGWAQEHQADKRMAPSTAQLEENVASLIGAMLTIVEQALKAQGDDALGMHAARASAELAEPPEDTDDESSDDNGYAPEL